MGEERDYRAEYEALLKQYEADKKQEQEKPCDIVDEHQDEQQNEKKLKRDKFFGYTYFILIIAMIAFLKITDEWFKTEPNIIFGVVFIFLGLIFFSFLMLGEPVAAVAFLIILVSSGIAMLCDAPYVAAFLFMSIFFFSFLSTAIKNTNTLIQLLRKMKPLKKSCTEKVTAICINPNQRDRGGLLKENIEVIPRCISVKTRRGRGVRVSNVPLDVLCCPVYELDYYGTKYTLCDNYYGITGVEEGESREILINPENPQEFYDKKRYKSDLRQIIKTIPIIPLILIIFMIALTVLFSIVGYHNSLG